MELLTTTGRDDLIAAVARHRQQPRAEVKAAAMSLGKIALPDGRLLIADSTRWYIGTPVEAR